MLRPPPLFLPISPEAGEVNDVECRDVVGLSPQVLLPKALPPEAEAVHLLVVVAEWSVGIRRPLLRGITRVKYSSHPT